MEIQAADTGRRDTARPEHRQAGEALYSTYFALGEARADEVDGGGCIFGVSCTFTVAARADEVDGGGGHGAILGSVH